MEKDLKTSEYKILSGDIQALLSSIELLRKEKISLYRSEKKNIIGLDEVEKINSPLNSFFWLNCLLFTGISGYFISNGHIPGLLSRSLFSCGVFSSFFFYHTWDKYKKYIENQTTLKHFLKKNSEIEQQKEEEERELLKVKEVEGEIDAFDIQFRENDQKLGAFTSDERNFNFRFDQSKESLKVSERRVFQLERLEEKIKRDFSEAVSVLPEKDIYMLCFELCATLCANKYDDLQDLIFNSNTYKENKKNGRVRFGNLLRDFLYEFKGFILNEKLGRRNSAEQLPDQKWKAIEDDFRRIIDMVISDFDVADFSPLTKIEDTGNMLVFQEERQVIAKLIQKSFQDKNLFREGRLPGIENEKELFLCLSDQIMLYGSPGTGKTFLSKNILQDFLNEDGRNHVVFLITAKDIVNTRHLASFLYAVEKAIANGKKALVFIDEVEAIFAERKDNKNHESKAIVSQALVEFEKLKTKDACFIFCTNHRDLVDEAFLRIGRAEAQFEIGFPHFENRLALLQGTKCCNLLESQIEPTENELKTREYLDYRDREEYKDAFADYIAVLTAELNVPGLLQLSHDFKNCCAQHGGEAHSECIDLYKVFFDLSEKATNLFDKAIDRGDKISFLNNFSTKLNALQNKKKNKK